MSFYQKDMDNEQSYIKWQQYMQEMIQARLIVLLKVSLDLILKNLSDDEETMKDIKYGS
jgi:hypothetical protein